VDCKFNCNSVTVWLLFIFCQDYESSAACSVKNEADVDEKLSHMRPVVVLETLNLPRYVVYCKLRPELDKASVPVSKSLFQR